MAGTLDYVILIVMTAPFAFAFAAGVANAFWQFFRRRKRLLARGRLTEDEIKDLFPDLSDRENAVLPVWEEIGRILNVDSAKLRPNDTLSFLDVGRVFPGTNYVDRLLSEFVPKFASIGETIPTMSCVGDIMRFVVPRAKLLTANPLKGRR